MEAADVFASVRPAEVTVQCYGQPVGVQLHTAKQWIGAVGFNTETLAGVVPGAVDEQWLPLLWEHIDDEDAEPRWMQAARVAVGRGGGRDWWWSVNLIRKALTGWPYINGKLLLSNISAASMLLPDWLDACYMMLWSGCDDKNRSKLDLELSIPPAGVMIRQSKKQKMKMLADFAAD